MPASNFFKLTASGELDVSNGLDHSLQDLARVAVNTQIGVRPNGGTPATESPIAWSLDNQAEALTFIKQALIDELNK